MRARTIVHLRSSFGPCSARPRNREFASSRLGGAVKSLAISLMLAVTLMVSSGYLLSAPQNLARKASRNPTLAFEAKATKPVYAKGENVEFSFTLRNGGEDTLMVVRQFQLRLNVSLEITDSQGLPVEWCGRIAEVIPSKNLYRALSPGESIHTNLNIACVNRENPRIAWGYNLKAPGKYTVKATYRLPQPKEVLQQLFPERQVVRGPLFADPVMIELQ